MDTLHELSQFERSYLHLKALWQKGELLTTLKKGNYHVIPLLYVSYQSKSNIWVWYRLRLHLILSQTSPGFYMSAVKVF